MMGFIATHAGIIGLLFFFIFFCTVAVWVFRPGSKLTYKNFAQIPFLESDQ